MPKWTRCLPRRTRSRKCKPETRHRITIQTRTDTQDGASQPTGRAWANFVTNEPAEKRDPSGRELITAAVAVHSETNDRVCDSATGQGSTPLARVLFEGAVGR